MFTFLPNSFLQMCAIFLSIVIEALPFVLLGCIISGALQIFLTAERVKKILPSNKFLATCLGAVLGFFFPSCECGIIPIVNQFMRKGVPEYVAFSFMLTAPIINPIVIFSTYMAFGNSWHFSILRVLGSFIVALCIGGWLAYINKAPILKTEFYDSSTIEKEAETPKEKLSFGKRIFHTLEHAIDEFYDTGRYLIFGSLVAAAMQTYLPTSFLLRLGSTKPLGILVMMILAFTLSLCSEADAFIGASLLSLFGSAPIVAFLVFGPMVDIKNILMMKRYFHTKFILQLIGILAVLIFIYALVL